MAPAVVKFRQFWGECKREELLAILEHETKTYDTLLPTEANQFLLRPGTATVDYPTWPSLADVARVLPILGLNENRGGGLMADSRSEIEARMQTYFDPKVSFEELGSISPQLASDRAKFPARSSRQRILSQEA
jgi:hypothetical protein